MADQQSTPEPSQPEPMTRDRALELLRTDVAAWNRWRDEYPEEKLPNLRNADLRDANLSGCQLERRRPPPVPTFVRCLPSSVPTSPMPTSSSCQPSRRYLASREAKVTRSLPRAAPTLSSANLRDADLSRVPGSCGANLFATTNLDSSDLSNAHTLAYTVFGDLDLSNTRGLESIDAPQARASSGLDTLARSKGQIPAEFLRGCGLCSPGKSKRPSSTIRR